MFILLFAVLIIMAVFGWKLYFIESGSMEPLMYRDDAVIVSNRVSYTDLQVGDIIVYDRPDGLCVIHRIIDKTDNGLILKGDANNGPDGWPVTPVMYRGKMIIKISKIGAVLRALKRPLSASLIAICITGVFFVSDMLRDKKHEAVHAKN